MTKTETMFMEVAACREIVATSRDGHTMRRQAGLQSIRIPLTEGQAEQIRNLESMVLPHATPYRDGMEYKDVGGRLDIHICEEFDAPC